MGMYSRTNTRTQSIRNHHVITNAFMLIYFSIFPKDDLENNKGNDVYSLIAFVHKQKNAHATHKRQNNTLYFLYSSFFLRSRISLWTSAIRERMWFNIPIRYDTTKETKNFNLKLQSKRKKTTRNTIKSRITNCFVDLASNLIEWDLFNSFLFSTIIGFFKFVP